MQQTSNLPISAIKTEFSQAIVQHNMLVLSAPPGAGKSTCLPLWLLSMPEFAKQKIYLLQPRRIAVKNIALYLAQQLGEKIGETIGYRLRNETRVSKTTRLEVITEGILTQIIQQDAELSGCALVVFDEFHERSLHGDLAFAFTREVQQSLRDDLKILLMSATLDTDYLLKVLPDAVSLASEGRSYPVEIDYQPATNIQKWRVHALNVVKNKAKDHQGSILVFLPGVGDIRFISEQLAADLPQDLLLCCLYGELSLKEQQQAIAPCVQGRRKLVLATNIAETSITIDGINLVIDCGLEKVAVYDSASLTNRLTQKQIAKSSAIQRAGRAGRLMAGQCIRLFAKENFDRRPEESTHDIQQADLLPTLIEAARWGVKSLSHLSLLELPNSKKEQQAWQELQRLHIVNDKIKLTAHGEQVALLPCHPRYGHMILSAANLESQYPQLTALACLITAMLEERDIFTGKQALFDCDLTHRIQKLIAVKRNSIGVFSRVWQQAQVLSKRVNTSLTALTIHSSLLNTGLLLAFAYPERIAKQRSIIGEYIAVNGKGFSMNNQDALAGEQYIVSADVMQLANVLKIRLASSITAEQIAQIYQQHFTEETKISFNESSGKLTARKQQKLGSIILNEKNDTSALTTAVVSEFWCQQVSQKGLGFLNWHTSAIALKTRWQWLVNHSTDLGLTESTMPPMHDRALLESLAVWFSPFVGSIKSKGHLDKLNLTELLLSLLDYQQQQHLKKCAPSFYIGPTGRQCPISYNVEERSPKVSLPMQEVYGLTQTPSVGCMGNNQGIVLLLELLSPAQRPIQVTQDLAQFWQGSYKAVQKDMKSQYPRHFWPDDPANAKPTNKTKRHLTITK